MAKRTLWRTLLRRLNGDTNRSKDLDILYERFPAMKGLVRTSLYFGIFRGLMDLSVGAKLYMNLPDIGVLSTLTSFSFNVPGDYLGEVRGTDFVNERVNAISPRSKVASLLESSCGFLEDAPMKARISLEEYLKEKYFETDAEFEERYLRNFSRIDSILQRHPEGGQAAREIGDVLFGTRSPLPCKDQTLISLLQDLRPIDADEIEQSLRKFYGQISAIPANIPTSSRLWTRGRYIDLVRGFASVAKNGFYDEMDEELKVIREAEETIKDIKEGKKLSRDDYADLDRIAREYLAFLMTTQVVFHEGEENLNRVARILDAVKRGHNLEPGSKRYLGAFIAEYRRFLDLSRACFPDADLASLESKLHAAGTFMNGCVETRQGSPDDAIGLFTDYMAKLRRVDASMDKETLESKIRSVRDLIRKIGSKEIHQKTEELDELLAYIDSREYAMKSAGVSEKRAYCPLAEAKRRFIDSPLAEFTRDLTKAETDSIIGLCFSEAERTTKYEIATQGTLFGLLGLSWIRPEFSETTLVNAIAWGLPLAGRSLMESYYTTKGGRVMTAAMTHIFFKSFEKEGINAETAFSEYDSTMMQAYNRGYFGAMAGSLLPAYYATSSANPLPLTVPIFGSLVFFGLAYRSWFSSVRALKSQIYEHAKGLA
ncbi:hypothetical protein JXB02_02870 [Candidatus Woesearchaeota archaeon]|nr:hypothetical protein [Candidatus Woesearchaeota archaeon]